MRVDTNLGASATGSATSTDMRTYTKPGAEGVLRRACAEYARTLGPGGEAAQPPLRATMPPPRPLLCIHRHYIIRNYKEFALI